MKRAFLSSSAEHGAVQVVDDPEVAPRLLAPKTLHFLSPFVGRALSLSEAAGELNVSLPRLHYQVGTLRALGVLDLAGSARRSGRAVKLYRATADAFFVPFRAMDSETVEVALAKGDEPWRSLYFHSLAQLAYELGGPWGVRLERDEQGLITARVVPHAGPFDPDDGQLPAALLGGWVSDLYLDFADAKALRRELAAVLERYQGRRGAGRYLAQLRLAPLLDKECEVPRVTTR